MTTAASTQIVPQEPASLPALRATDQGVAEALEAVLSDNTNRVYGTQWRLFDEWCAEVGLVSLPASPSPSPVTWPPAPPSAPASPPCASPCPPSARLTSGPSWNRPAGTRACAPL